MVQSGDCPPDLEAGLNKIAEKVPVLDALQNKVQEFKELEPELKSVSKQLDSLTDWSDMEAAKLGGDTIRQIYHAQDLPTIQPVKDMMKARIMGNYNAAKAGLAVKNAVIDHVESVKAAAPALSSVGEVSNFLGASATSTDVDINKMVESAFEKHHLVEKISNLKELEKKKASEDSSTADVVSDSVAKSMKENHLSEKIADLRKK